MRRALAALAVAGAVALGVNGCHGTDPSPDPGKPCPAGQVRRVVNIKPAFEYECFPVTVHRVTTHRKKRR